MVLQVFSIDNNVFGFNGHTSEGDSSPIHTGSRVTTRRYTWLSFISPHRYTFSWHADSLSNISLNSSISYFGYDLFGILQLLGYCLLKSCRYLCHLYIRSERSSQLNLIMHSLYSCLTQTQLIFFRSSWIFVCANGVSWLTSWTNHRYLLYLKHLPTVTIFPVVLLFDVLVIRLVARSSPNKTVVVV